MKKFILYGFFICMLLLFNGCDGSNTSSGTTDTKSFTGLVKENKKADNILQSETQTEGNSEPGSPAEKVYVIPSNIVKPESTVVFENVEYKLSKIEITKKIGDWDRSLFNPLWEETDEKGNITNDNSYGFVHVTINNKNNSNKEICIGSTLDFSAINDDGSANGVACEPVYLNPSQNKDDPHRAMMYMLEPNKTYEIEIAFLLEDSMVNKNLYFMIGSMGYEGYLDPDSKFIPAGVDEQ